MFDLLNESRAEKPWLLHWRIGWPPHRSTLLSHCRRINYTSSLSRARPLTVNCKTNGKSRKLPTTTSSFTHPTRISHTYLQAHPQRPLKHLQWGCGQSLFTLHWLQPQHEHLSRLKMAIGSNGFANSSSMRFCYWRYQLYSPKWQEKRGTEYQSYRVWFRSRCSMDDAAESKGLWGWGKRVMWTS